MVHTTSQAPVEGTTEVAILMVGITGADIEVVAGAGISEVDMRGAIASRFQFDFVFSRRRFLFHALPDR